MNELQNAIEYSEARFVLLGLVAHVHAANREKGFWNNADGEYDPGGRNFGEACSLITCEISEAVEADRDGNPPSVKIPGFSHVEEELADAVIRILDLAGGKGFDVPGAILAKLEHNATRPHKHGKRY